MRRLLHVRHLPCLCPRGPAGPDPGDAGRRGREARGHREPPAADQPPLLPARRLAADGGARRLSTRDADLTFSMPTGLAKIVVPAKAGIHPSAARTVTRVGPGFRRDAEAG